MSDAYIDKIVADTIEYKLKDSALTEAVGKLSQDVTELQSAVAEKTLCFTNITIETTDWTDQSSDPDVAGYPYKAEITAADVTTDYTPDVRFDVADATSGIFAPVAATGTDKVLIYASEVPSADITIPVIICTKVV